jgi:hypothetical protein
MDPPRAICQSKSVNRILKEQKNKLNTEVGNQEYQTAYTCKWREKTMKEAALTLSGCLAAISAYVGRAAGLESAALGRRVLIPGPEAKVVEADELP